MPCIVGRGPEVAIDAEAKQKLHVDEGTIWEKGPGVQLSLQLTKVVVIVAIPLHPTVWTWISQILLHYTAASTICCGICAATQRTSTGHRVSRFVLLCSRHPHVRGGIAPRGCLRSKFGNEVHVQHHYQHKVVLLMSMLLVDACTC